MLSRHSKTPETKVTVLMPVYNAEKYLKEAIDSILNQTFGDFEFLIINDGSTDRSKSIILSFSDPRINYVENEINIRLIATLNKGIELSKGEYIVRMDADDISTPDRIEKQVSYMDTHPEIGLCGSFMRTVGLIEDYDIHYKTTHDQIKFRLFFDTHFPHPTAIIRKSVLLDNNLRFRKEYIHAEDFELWNRMVVFSQIAIIPEILLLKRIHEEQISEVYKDIQDDISRRIRKELIKRLGVTITSEEMDVYENYLKNKKPTNTEEAILLLDLFEKFVIANDATGTYNKDFFNDFFSEKYWQLCSTSTQLGLTIFMKYIHSIFCKKNMVKNARPGRLLAKSILRYSSQ